MRMVSLSWALRIELPMPKIYPGSGSGFNRIQLNGGIFNHDDIPIEFQSILEGEYELTSSCGEDWVSFSYLLVIMDQNPHRLLLSERCMLLRPAEGTREDMDTNGSLTDGHSSDEACSLSGDE